ncbi:MAG TPA: NADP-dependent oxidoreductase [Saprospiraceae bacterium]|nr:NADP-dependent oxidoreductase [Saprospiraceae bacterium]HMW74405.1 NADP-dependent oxidoreductase [Saprospiraceae bacterium]HMX86172.1 NADP-dependent oxidoreductase [Saprospiraceae bacterium]HNA94586.1 NADP-dependent oxidoreductase [Saprospiraceae bacterium]HND16961.1 NADP-dependent oxidoreductase [Saprospiraceae bacterium]
MQAVQINKYGDNSVLEQVDIPIPKILPDQVLVKVKYASVNPVDYKIRSGFMAGVLPKSFPFTLGWEASGIITDTAHDVLNYKTGDEIILMSNFMQGGTYAEYVAVNAGEIMSKPTSLDFADAAVIPFSLGTAYTALLMDTQIMPGQKLLILGAGGAVGRMAIQIAKNLGLEVTGTAKGNDIQELLSLGIDHVVDYTKADYFDALNDFDVVLDLVGGETQAKSFKTLRKGGTIVSTTQPPDSGELQHYGLNGKMTRTKCDPEKFAVPLQWLEEGKIKVKEPQIMNFGSAKEALALVENREAKSKIVLSL